MICACLCTTRSCRLHCRVRGGKREIRTCMLHVKLYKLFGVGFLGVGDCVVLCYGCCSEGYCGSCFMFWVGLVLLVGLCFTYSYMHVVCVDSGPMAGPSTGNGFWESSEHVYTCTSSGSSGPFTKHTSTASSGSLRGSAHESVGSTVDSRATATSGAGGSYWNSIVGALHSQPSPHQSTP